MELYILWHEYYVEEEDYDVITEIAIYSTYEKAKAGLEKFKKHPKFAAHPDAFEIADIEVDLDDWTEGFVPIDD